MLRVYSLGNCLEHWSTIPSTNGTKPYVIPTTVIDLVVLTFIVPFVVTIVATLLFSSYMLFDPADWLASFMQLTTLTWDFKVFIFVLGVGYFFLAWVFEQYIFPRVAKFVGIAKQKMGKKKERKAYKLVQERMSA
jgi:hypothetical protein